MRRQDPNKIDKEKMASASSIPNLHVSSTAGAGEMEGKMLHYIETQSYNQRRYGKPWIAKVDFSKKAKGEYAWGEWAGDHYNGGIGVLTIDVAPGDIVAQGQKDYRKPRNSAPTFSVVKDDDTFEEIGDKGEVYRYYVTQKRGKIE